MPSATLLRLHREHVARHAKFFPSKNPPPKSPPSPPQLPTRSLITLDELERRAREIFTTIATPPRLGLTWVRMVPTEPTIRSIIEFVAGRYLVKVSDMISERRFLRLIVPRHIAMHLAITCTSKSYPATGAAFGHRDHTTILHAYHKVKSWRANDIALDRKLKDWECFLTYWNRGRIGNEVVQI